MVKILTYFVRYAEIQEQKQQQQKFSFASIVLDVFSKKVNEPKNT